MSEVVDLIKSLALAGGPIEPDLFFRPFGEALDLLAQKGLRFTHKDSTKKVSAEEVLPSPRFMIIREQVDDTVARLYVIRDDQPVGPNNPTSDLYRAAALVVELNGPIPRVTKSSWVGESAKESCGGSATVTARRCDDDGACHHRCAVGECFRRDHCSPLSETGCSTWAEFDQKRASGSKFDYYKNLGDDPAR